MPQTVTVLAYHRIARPGPDALAPTLIDAYPPDFAAQMRYVAANYAVISAWDLVRALREGSSLPHKALLITFDDGYRCFRDTALPVLQQLGLPVTLFVPTAFPGAPQQPFWWDALYAAVQHTTQSTLDVPGLGMLALGAPPERAALYERLVGHIERLPTAAAEHLVETILADCTIPPSSAPAILDWEELAALPVDSVAIGPHTQRHIILAQATPERVRAEVAGSWADLQAHLPRPLPLFCYPNGKPHAINRTAVQAVQAAGLAGAVTMVAGLNVVGRTNPYLLYRVGMVAGESLGRFAFKLTPTARLYRRLKARLRPHLAETFTLQSAPSGP